MRLQSGRATVEFLVIVGHVYVYDIRSKSVICRVLDVTGDGSAVLALSYEPPKWAVANANKSSGVGKSVDGSAVRGNQYLVENEAFAVVTASKASAHPDPMDMFSPANSKVGRMLTKTGATDLRKTALLGNVSDC